MKVSCPSFELDHTTLEPGLYLRETRRVGLSKLRIWDLRFIHPTGNPNKVHKPLSSAVMHSIEHIMALKLREVLGPKYIGFYTYGCKTGFALVTKNIPIEKIRLALIEVIEHSVPLCSSKEIPCLTYKECGNPKLFAVQATTTALHNYLRVLQK